jgi:hypothetical protein
VEQVVLIVLFGFMSFGTSSFWLSLYMQNVLKYSPLEVAVRLLPQAIVGILVNVVAALVLHKINNKVLIGIGSIACFGSTLLLSVMEGEHAYWAFIFPSLILAVVGVDLQFNVANVSSLTLSRNQRFAELLKMYVMSSLPLEKQSLGGGIFNTVTKLCIAVGLAISSSVYTAESTSDTVFQTTSKPYHMAFWVCTASAGIGLCLSPFLTIGTQGNAAEDEQLESVSRSEGTTGSSESKEDRQLE